MANVLGTGSAGYVGWQVLCLLKEAGHNPVVYDELRRGFARLVDPHGVPLVIGCLANRPLLRSVLKEHRINDTLHFAALAYVGESTEYPDQYFRINTVDAFGLIEEPVAYRPDAPPAIVFSSTCAVFGVPPKLPIQESSPRTPINPYGRSKLALGWMLEDLSRQHRYPAVILRYFNGAGSYYQNGTRECHKPETLLITLATKAALEGTSLFIYGDDFGISDGTAICDFVHVRELASARVSALDYLIVGCSSTDFNLCTGICHSVREVLTCVESVYMNTISVQIVPRRLGDPPALLADPAKAGKLFNWQPLYSGLERIVKDALTWEQLRQQIPSLGNPSAVGVK